jgi:N-acetylmuramoyl-L-alanine amidase
MFRLFGIASLAVTFTAALGGCVPPDFKTATNQPVPDGTVSVYSLAGRLGMHVEQSSRSLASLTGPGNRVLVLGNPDARVYVNGRVIGQTGKIQAVEDTLFVPLTMEPNIRSAMRGGRGPIEVATVGPKKTGTIEPPPPGGGSPIHGLVVIDPGHGGKDPGTMRGSLREKDLNLAVALLVTEDLKARGAKVLMTRPNDTFIELEDRAGASNRAAADLFLSIHTNYSVKPGICGFAVYVNESASGPSIAAAGAIAHRLEQGGISPCGSQPHRAGYKVLRLNSRPAVLLEMGFISNSGDAASLASPHYQRALADSVADGIADFLRGK